ncbi:hypothetical protein LJC08_02255 [Methanimicrococcus sp. OttesenSCG-928-J09]|nr:hypothetical protein [Methanimicrococcus sp. OttesenSCG-928-J09]
MSKAVRLARAGGRRNGSGKAAGNKQTKLAAANRNSKITAANRNWQGV